MSAITVRLHTSVRTVRPLPLPKKRALVVDDSTTILHAICSLLEHHKVVQVVGRAENGPETIDRVAELQPELVLLDADMPGMSGLRTALLISQMHPHIEIILMSMDTSAQFRAACAGCGATAMIYKPKFLRELRTFLNAPLQKARTAFGLRA
ncbi:MAG TPA: response regulator [Candidatus Angelobacter sp.]|nr:response regulator [Candidatus Angelobacter sp.]